MSFPLLHPDQDPGVAWGGQWALAACGTTKERYLRAGGRASAAGAGAWSGGTDWGCDCRGQGHGREELAVGGRSPVEPVSAGRPGLGREMPAGTEGVAAQGRLQCGVSVCLQLTGEDSCSVFLLKAEPLDEGGLRRGRGGLACLELGGPDGCLLRLQRQELGGLLSGAVGCGPWASGPPSPGYFTGLWTQLWPRVLGHHPSTLGLSGTACPRQGWVGRALRR